MARGAFPSMTALLGLLAVAGYQNRDQLAQMLGNRGGAGGGTGGAGGGLADALGGLLGGGSQDRNRDGIPDAAQRGGSAGGLGGGSMGGAGGLGGLLGSLAGGAGGAGLGGLLGGGLGELSGRMRETGHGEAVDSWVGPGPNRSLEPHDLEAALGPDVLEDLTEQTGLSRQEILARLSRELPEAVNQYTPHGRLPNDDDYRA